MMLFKIISAIALSYCAYHAGCIVKELREGRASSRPRPGQSRALPSRPRPGQSRALPSRPSLASLLSISRTLEVCHDGN